MSQSNSIRGARGSKGEIREVFVDNRGFIQLDDAVYVKVDESMSAFLKKLSAPFMASAKATGATTPASIMPNRVSDSVPIIKPTSEPAPSISPDVLKSIVTESMKATGTIANATISYGSRKPPSPYAVHNLNASYTSSKNINGTKNYDNHKQDMPYVVRSLNVPFLPKGPESPCNCSVSSDGNDKEWIGISYRPSPQGSRGTTAKIDIADGVNGTSGASDTNNGLIQYGVDDLLALRPQAAISQNKVDTVNEFNKEWVYNPAPPVNYHRSLSAHPTTKNPAEKPLKKPVILPITKTYEAPECLPSEPKAIAPYLPAPAISSLPKSFAAQENINPKVQVESACLVCGDWYHTIDNCYWRKKIQNL